MVAPVRVRFFFSPAVVAIQVFVHVRCSSPVPAGPSALLGPTRAICRCCPCCVTGSRTSGVLFLIGPEGSCDLLGPSSAFVLGAGTCVALCCLGAAAVAVPWAAAFVLAACGVIFAGAPRQAPRGFSSQDETTRGRDPPHAHNHTKRPRQVLPIGAPASWLASLSSGARAAGNWQDTAVSRRLRCGIVSFGAVLFNIFNQAGNWKARSQFNCGRSASCVVRRGSRIASAAWFASLLPSSPSAVASQRCGGAVSAAVDESPAPSVEPLSWNRPRCFAGAAPNQTSKEDIQTIFFYHPAAVASGA